jgi:hypothetical protein
MDLWKVRGNGCVLYFPTTLPQSELLRGGKGYVVDLHAPCESGWCADQMWKLEPAPEAKEADRITNRAALAEIVKAKASAAAQGSPGSADTKLETVPPSEGGDPLEVKPQARARKAG